MSAQDPIIEELPPPDNDFPTPPDGWQLRNSGVFETRPGKDDEPPRSEPVCGVLYVTGLTTGTAGDWGRMLVFHDHDGTRKSLAIPAARLHEDPAILARELANAGLRIIPGKERRLVAYLASFTPENRIQSAPRLGWMERTDGGLAFIFPDRVLSAAGHDAVVYQPERYSPTIGTVHPSGTLESWRENIGQAIAQSDALLFVACAGLATPWLKLADSDSFIIHLWGTTSRGKTTLAQVAASVWGCAVDPAESPSLSFIRRWNATANGIEGLAEAHSDLPLCLDELGAGNHRDIAPLVYQLAGGQGKTAMTASRELKAPRAWRTIAVSTGELSMESKLAENGKPPKGGTLHRALDIEVQDIAGHLPENERAGYVQRIKRACATHYGTAGAATLAAIMAEYPDTPAAREAASQGIAEAIDRLQQPHHAPEQVRALRRFALIGWAGVFAARHGVLPVTPARVWEAVQSIAHRWGSTSTGTDTDRITEAVAAFILKHGARFQPTTSEQEVRDRAGFVDHAAGRWLFTKAALQEAAPGNDATTIARAIQAAGHLFTNDGHLCPKTHTPAGRVRMYCVLESVLSDDSTERHKKTPGQVGQVGQTAPELGIQPAPEGEATLGQLGQETRTNAEAAPVPQLKKTTGADANPHQNRPRPSAPPAPAKNSVTEAMPGEIIDEVEL